MYLNFKKESTNLINDFNNFKFLKKKYIKEKKKKKLNIYSLLVSNNNTESLKVNDSLDIFKFKNFLKIMRNIQKKKYDNKKVFKFWKKKIYFKKKNIKKKKKNIIIL